MKGFLLNPLTLTSLIAGILGVISLYAEGAPTTAPYISWALSFAFLGIGLYRESRKAKWRKCFFVKADEYLSGIEYELFTKCGLLERLKEIEIVRKFIQDKQSKVLIVHAPSGHGKSYFIIEAARTLELERKQEWRCRFCRPSIRTVEDAIQDEINPKAKHLICLGNADTYESTAKKLVQVLKSRAIDNLKIILTCRTPSIEVVTGLVREQRESNIVEIELQKLSEKALTSLLLEASGGLDVPHPERLIRALGHNPQLIISAGKIAQGQIDIHELRAKVSESLNNSTKILCSLGYSEAESKGLIRELASIVPVYISDKQVLGGLSAAIGTSPDSIRKAIDILIEHKVLRYVGISVRFSEDVGGDMLLSSALDEKDGKTILNEILQRWKDERMETLSRNIAAAAQYSDTDNIQQVIDETILSFIKFSDKNSIYNHKATLAWAARLVSIAPARIADLVMSFLASQVDAKEISSDDYGPILIQLSHIHGHAERALELLLDIKKRGIEGTFSNYKTEEIVRSAISPVKAHIVTATESMSVLEKWSRYQNCDSDRADLIIAGIEEALAGSHQVEDSYGGQITFGRRVLKLVPSVREFRDIAMNALKHLLMNQTIHVRARSVKAIGHIGYWSEGSKSPMWSRICEDISTALYWVSQMFDSCPQPFLVQTQAEDTLIYIWAHNEIHPEESETAEDLLRRLDRSPEYLLYRLYVGDDFFAIDINSILSEAPDKDRWKWLVENHFKRYDITSDDLLPVIVKLNNRYQTAQDILGYLCELNASVEDSHMRLPIVEVWAQHNSEAILRIVNDQMLSSSIPERFSDGFASVAARNDPKYIEDYASMLRGLTAVSTRQINCLLALISENPSVGKKLTQWLNNLIPKLDKEGVVAVIRNCYYVYRKLPEEEHLGIISVIDTILKGDMLDETIDTFDFLIRQITKEGWTTDAQIRPLLAQILDKLRGANTLEYHAQSLIELAIDGNLHKFLDLVEIRLKMGYSASTRFDPIPHGGFRILSNLVKTYEDFKIVTDRVALWDSQEIIISFDKEYMLEPIVEKSDENKGRYLEYAIKEFIASGTTSQLASAISCITSLELSTTSAEIYYDLIVVGRKVGLAKESEDCLVHAVFSGGYSSELGKPSLQRLAKKDALEIILEKCPMGELRDKISSLISSIDAEIERGINEDAEILEPKL